MDISARQEPALNELRHSVCALDCPDCCSLLVTVKDGRGTRLQGHPQHPITRGFLCGKVAQYLEREYSPQRLLYPLRRTGAKGEGRFEQVSWDEALDGIAARLQAISAQWGPESLLPYSYAGTMGYLNGSGMDRRFFHRLGASRLDRTICAAAGAAGLEAALGVRYGTEPEQFREARLILAWGANILGTNVHLWPFIVEARRRGARFYTIDPVLNRTGKAADRHFAINPGSDAALALGMMRVIITEQLWDSDYVAHHTEGFAGLAEKVAAYPPHRVAELTGLPAEDIIGLAREYATTRPAVIRLNYGVQRSERGALAVRAIALLPALTGAFKDIGGGLQLTTSGAFTLNRAGLERPDLQLLSPLGREARLVNMSELAKALNDLDKPPVKALVVYNSNPAAIAPAQNRVRQGLLRDDLFTVVLEQFATDTTRYADFVLPVTTFLEHTDLYFAYGHYYLQLARPALPRPGAVRSNVDIFRGLAQRMGFADPCFSDAEEDMIRTLLDTSHPFAAGVTLEQLEAEHWVRLHVSPEGTPFLPFAQGGFATPSGKCQFRAETLDYQPPDESRCGVPDLLAQYPLELVSSKNDDSMNSTFGHRPWVDAQTARLWIHPADAAARHIQSGDEVTIWNSRGSCRLEAEVTVNVKPGVVRAPSVRWPQSAPDHRNVNVLTSEKLTDAGGGPTFYSCLVEVAKAAFEPRAGGQ